MCFVLARLPRGSAKRGSSAASGVDKGRLKDALLKADKSFNEANLGFRNFGSFVRSAEARDLITVTGKNDERVVKLAARRRAL